MLRRRQLALLLSQLAPIPHPKLKWEGYTLDAESAASIAHIAAQVYDDLRGKKVIDLGCGSGILAIAASLLGAKWVVGVDIDGEAIRVAVGNANKLKVNVDFVTGDIRCINGHFDTTLMNPPFGSWHRGADIRFLKKALEISDVVYSLHKGSPSVREFLSRQIPRLNGVIDKIYEINLTIGRTYRFHRKRQYLVKADLYRVIRTKN